MTLFCAYPGDGDSQDKLCIPDEEGKRSSLLQATHIARTLNATPLTPLPCTHQCNAPLSDRRCALYYVCCVRVPCPAGEEGAPDVMTFYQEDWDMGPDGKCIPGC